MEEGRRVKPFPPRGAVVDKAVYHEGQKRQMYIEVEKCWLWQQVLCNSLVCFPPMCEETKTDTEKNSKEADSIHFNASDKHYVIWRIL